MTSPSTLNERNLNEKKRSSKRCPTGSSFNGLDSWRLVKSRLNSSRNKAETYPSTDTRKSKEEQQKLFINSLTVENQYDYVANQVSPYWNLTYDKQLEKKNKRTSVIVDVILTRSGIFHYPPNHKILPIVPSPVTKAYRNKDEFFIWSGVDGNPKTVGCTVGKPSLGRALSVHPTNIVTIKESHKRVAQVYEDFIRLSTVPANYRLEDGGHWRSITIRSNDAGEVMASVVVQPLKYTYHSRQTLRKELKDYFFRHLPNISLYHQECSKLRCSHIVAPFILLYGKKYLMETLNGYNFETLPDTFFKTNNLCTELLYETIIKSAKLKPDTIFLDMSSSSGLISFMASKFVKRVFTFEFNQRAVIEAKYNAEFNNVHNLTFVNGRQEFDVVSVLESLHEPTDVVVVLNPGHAQKLGWNILGRIRKSIQISRVVYDYVTCKPYSPNLFQNFEHLVSKALSFPPFTLTKAIPIDIFPHTPNFEIILTFER